MAKNRLKIFTIVIFLTILIIPSAANAQTFQHETDLDYYYSDSDLTHYTFAPTKEQVRTFLNSNQGKTIYFIDLYATDHDTNEQFKQLMLTAYDSDDVPYIGHTIWGMAGGTENALGMWLGVSKSWTYLDKWSASTVAAGAGKDWLAGQNANTHIDQYQFKVYAGDTVVPPPPDDDEVTLEDIQWTIHISALEICATLFLLRIWKRGT